VFVLTFSDASTSVAVDWIKDYSYGFGEHWNVLKEPKMIFVNNSGFFQRIHTGNDNEMILNFWKIGCSFMSKLIQKANMISPKSLIITKKLMS
jgi:hypothetical protein